MGPQGGTDYETRDTYMPPVSAQLRLKFTDYFGQTGDALDFEVRALIFDRAHSLALHVADDHVYLVLTRKGQGAEDLAFEYAHFQVLERFRSGR